MRRVLTVVAAVLVLVLGAASNAVAYKKPRTSWSVSYDLQFDAPPTTLQDIISFNATGVPASHYLVYLSPGSVLHIRLENQNGDQLIHDDAFASDLVQGRPYYCETYHYTVSAIQVTKTRMMAMLALYKDGQFLGAITTEVIDGKIGEPIA